MIAESVLIWGIALAVSGVMVAAYVGENCECPPIPASEVRSAGNLRLT